MKGIMKKAVSVFVAIALVITSLHYVPTTVDAADDYNTLSYTELTTSGAESIYYSIVNNGLDVKPWYGDGGATLMFQYDGAVNLASDTTVSINDEEVSVGTVVTEVANGLVKINPKQLADDTYTKVMITTSNDSSTIIVKKGEPSSSTEKSFYMLEAEAGVKSDRAQTTASASCSNEYYVQNLGNTDTGGNLTYTVNASEAGERTLKIYYMTDDTSRYFDVVVNGGESVRAAAAISSGWSTPTTEPAEITITLQEGTNTIWLGRLDGWGPNVDKIEIELTASEAVATVISMIDSLPTTVTTGDIAQVSGIYASYQTITNKSAVTNYSKLADALEICGLAVTTLEPLEDAYLYNFSEENINTFKAGFSDPNKDKVADLNGTYEHKMVLNGKEMTVQSGQNVDLSTAGLTEGTEYPVYMYAVYTAADGTVTKSDNSETTYFTYVTTQVEDYTNGIAQIHFRTSQSQTLKDQGYNIYTDTSKKKSNTSIVVKTENGAEIEAADYGTLNVRGNSTSLAQKKAFNFKFNSKYNLFGLSGSDTVTNAEGTTTTQARKGTKKWSLLANIFDKTLMRNDISMQFQRALEGTWGTFPNTDTSKVFTSECKTVDVYVDGRYVGVYTLIESVDVDESRVNIDIDYAIEGTDEIDSSYTADTVTIEGTTYTTYDVLLELANDAANDANRLDDECYYFSTLYETFALNDPERTNKDYDYSPTSANRPEFVKKTEEFVDAFENALILNDYTIFSQFIDVQSFIDFYITTEYFMLKDINFSSTRFYIRDGKLYAGPLWDADLSSGNIVDHMSWEDLRTKTEFKWFDLLLSNATFLEAVKTRYNSLHESWIPYFYTDGGVVDQMAGVLSTAAKTNYENAYNGYLGTTDGWGYTYVYGIQQNRWDQTVDVVSDANTAISRGVYASYNVHSTYNEYVEEYKTWLQNRDEWMHTALNELEATAGVWIEMPDNSGAGTVEYYYMPSVADEMSIFPGTGELSNSLQFVMSEGIASVTVNGNTITEFEGAGIYIDKADIEPNTVYTMVVEATSGNTATIKFKYEHPVDSTNIAYEKTFTGGTSAEGFDISDINDEFDYSKWQAASLNDSWFVVDLGAQYEIEEIEILFGAPYADGFELQFSKNNNLWVNARTVSAFNGSQGIAADGQIKWSSTSTLAMNNPNYGCLGKARYIKFKANTTVPANSGVSVFEFVVRGTKLYGYNSNLSVVEAATVISSDGSDIENAVDGDATTGWISDGGYTNSYIMFDLDTIHTINTVDLKFGSSYASSFRIQISDDGSVWNDVKTINNWAEPGSEATINNNASYQDKIFTYSLHMDEIETRYIRVYVDGAVMSTGVVDIKEIEIWGRAADKTEYWKNQSQDDYGIYVIDEVCATQTDSGATSMKDIELVQSDVLAAGCTYQTEYEAGNTISFFMNPYNHYIDFATEVFCPSSGADALAHGANYDPAILSYSRQIDATVEYIMADNVDFGENDYVITQIAFQIWKAEDLTEGVPKEGTSALEDIKINVKLLKNRNVDIVDTIMEDGQLEVENPVEGATYIWQRSQDGVNWENVNEKRYDLEIITQNGSCLNVAMDLGGGYYYRVKASGTDEWSHPYKVPYYNNVRNGDFEAPAMSTYAENNSPFNSNADEQQFPNGYPGIMWKTTAAGWKNDRNGINVGQDIEIVNGRFLKQWGESYWGFSVPLDEMYGDSVHGDQFAELNCENAGALYQDILTTPGSECYWELDQAGRMQQNTMYVVAMSTTKAKNHVSETEINSIVELARNAGMDNTGAEDFIDATAVTLSNGDIAYVWKVEGDATAGIWTHHTGRYIVPDGTENYLTRFFFVSDATTCINNDPTIGNFLDNVSFEMKQSYTIEYYIEGINNNNPVYTVDGMSAPYDRISIPSDISSTGYDLNDYTYIGSQIGGSSADSIFKAYYLDNTMKYTIAYEHNVLRLYFEAGVIAITKKINGMTSIPEDYTFTFDVMNEAGTETYYTTTVDGSAFTAIDKVNETEPDSCFITVSFKVSETTNPEAFVENASFTVRETVSNPKVAMDDGYDKYLYNVDANGTAINVPISDIANSNVTYSGEFTYSGANDSITFVNTYETVKKLKITKTVTGNMGEREKYFDFTLKLEMDGVAVSASIAGANATETESGTYTFSLKHKESIEFMVYDGCDAEISEAEYQYYTPTWNVTEEQATIDISAQQNTVNGVQSVDVNNIKANKLVTCNNDNNDIGDVEVQGFQMNTSTSEGSVSEFNPSFRVVYRVAKNTIKRNQVVKRGIIYGLTDKFEEGYEAKNIMVLDQTTLDTCGVNQTSSFDSEKYDGIIYSHITNEEVGIYQNWTSTDVYSEDVWDYYALTIKGLKYIYEALEQDITFRAYAIVEDDNGNRKVEYGKNIYTVNMYEIAQDLYENQKVSSKEGHEFLYNNVLNIVNIHKNKGSIANAVLYGLGGSSVSGNLDICTNIFQDMQDYVYCEREYANTYPRVGETAGFKPKKVNEEDILPTLNAAVGTDYSSLNDWCYEQTELVKDGKYAGKGYYNRIEYSWDDGIFKDFGTD